MSGTALRVPYKIRGILLKTCKKNKTKHTSNLSKHTRCGPRCGGPRGPPNWPNQVPPPLAGSASLEGSRPPSSEFRLARGLRPPSSGFRLARGLTPLSSGLRLARGLPHERTCSRTRVRAFNALTQQSHAIACLGITPRRCSANSLGEAHPCHCGDCVTRPVSAP
jgi:hypothetical protein